MMNKRIICLLCAAVIALMTFTACRKIAVDLSPTDLPDSTEQSGSTKNPAPTKEAIQTTEQVPTNVTSIDDPQSAAYWKTAGFDGIEIETGDYWSDLFLWDDGTGCFRFSQATPASNYYGMLETISCDWTLDQNGSLTLLRPGTKVVVYTGIIADDVLTIHYDGYLDEKIVMEPAEAPPYGAHWIIPDLYGTWKMTSYTDAASGYHATPNNSADGENGSFASEITLDSVIGAHFWLADPFNSRHMADRSMGIGYYDDDNNWHPYTFGPIWAGCVNEAWHVELTGNDDPNVHYYVTYADSKLLMKKEDKNNPDSFPSSFTAEFEYVGYRDDLEEGFGNDTIDRRYAQAAYSVILSDYHNALKHGGDSDEKAEYAVRQLRDDARIDSETALRELYTSLEEPLHYIDDCVFGYAVRDVSEDGVPELFILYEDDYLDDYVISAIYTLHESNTALVGAYWSRNRCTLAIDGTIYVNGSSGADDSFSASFSLSRTGKLRLIETFGVPYEPDITAAEAGLVFTPLANLSSANKTSNAGGNQVDSAAEGYLFNRIVGYKGSVYSIYASPEIPNAIGLSGSDKFMSLPKAIVDRSADNGMYMLSFTIYQDKIYYLVAEPGSDITPGIVFRCNLDGSQREDLADANNFSTCMISDGWLYCDGYLDGGDYEIYAIDLNEMRLVRDSEFPEYAEPGIIEYNGFVYYFSGSTLCKKNIITEAGTEIMTLSKNRMNTGGDGVVIAVTNDTVYYATAGEYSDRGNVYLFSVSTSGGTGELLASWFTS